jgi:GT2 family glycosyltransferase
MIIDVIMLVRTDSEKLHKMTQNAIDSLHDSETEFQFNIFLLESNKNSKYQYKKCTLIVPEIKGDFNYNRYMNYGISKCENEYVVLANNDLFFHKNWFTEIYKHKNKAESFSSWNNFDNWHSTFAKIDLSEFNEEGYKEGYRTSYEMTGWCFVAKRNIFDEFTLDERVDFWYSDNVYSDDLQKYGFRHILVRDSKVDHLCSKTTETFSKQKIKELTSDQYKKYNNGN